MESFYSNFVDSVRQTQDRLSSITGEQKTLNNNFICRCLGLADAINLAGGEHSSKAKELLWARKWEIESYDIPKLRFVSYEFAEIESLDR